MELCIEIALDLGLRLELPALQQQVSQAMAARRYGTYAADKRMQERLHAEEMARISQWK